MQKQEIKFSWGWGWGEGSPYRGGRVRRGEGKVYGMIVGVRVLHVSKASEKPSVGNVYEAENLKCDFQCFMV